MEIEEVNIIGYKSLLDVSIPFKEYGEGSTKSKATFLVGINESGKSSLIKALSYLNSGLGEVDYDEVCNKESHRVDEFIDIYIRLKTTDPPYWSRHIKSKTKLPTSLLNQIEIRNITKNIDKKGKTASVTYVFNDLDGIPFFQYVVEESEEENDDGEIISRIYHLKNRNKIEEEINLENADSLLLEGQSLLTKKYLNTLLANSLITTLKVNEPRVIYWKSESKYLIDKTIDLNEFKKDIDSSLPLRNILYIYGLKDSKEIENAIDKALKSQEATDEFKEKVSDKVTKQINKIWKEHKIKLRLSINSANCQIQVEDNDKKYDYFKLNQRSDGFKQFVSLILSISAENLSGKLKNCLILIDEPEVHIHPSGIKYMLDELIKIGKNNHVVIATHSPFLIDITTPERHWILKKEKGITEISQVDRESTMMDDKVLSAAFGLDVFKELLPPIIYIVEGQDDKYIIGHSLKLLKNDLFHSIKPAGGASKMPAIARLLSEENIEPLLIFDADKEGRDNLKLILQKQRSHYNNENVFLLTTINNELPVDSTIEDLLPTNYVKEFFESEMNSEFNLESESAIVKQLIRQNETLRTDKQKRDSLKIKLAKKFIEEYNTKEKIETIDRLSLFVANLIGITDRRNE